MPNRTAIRRDREPIPDPAIDAGAPAPLDDKSQQLLAALSELRQATAGALAEHVGIGYSTTTPKLRKLNDLGLAESAKAGNGQTVWRLTEAGLVHPAESDEAAEGEIARNATTDEAVAVSGVVDATPAGADTVAAEPAEQPTGHQTAGHDAAVGTDSGARAADEDGTPQAGITSVAASDEVEATDADNDNREVVHDGDGAGGTVPADVAEVHVADDEGAAPAPADATSAESVGVHPTGTTAPGSDEPAPDADTMSAAASGARTLRRAPGSLDKAVMVILRAKPDVVFKVGELCKLINQAEAGTGVSPASPGAVVLACQRRVNAGEAILAVEKPASFQLMPGTVAEPTPITVAVPADAGDAVRAG